MKLVCGLFLLTVALACVQASEEAGQAGDVLVEGGNRCSNYGGRCMSKSGGCSTRFVSGLCPGSTYCCAPSATEKTNPKRTNAKRVLKTIAGHKFMSFQGDFTYWFTGNLDVDADGAPNAYGPRGRTCNGKPPIDYLANAGWPGKGYGLAWPCTNKRKCRPCVQKQGDPCPGFYVSATAIGRSWVNSAARCSPNNYLNSVVIPYFVIPGRLGLAGGKGDYGLVYDPKTQIATFGIVGDVGPRDHTGEGSVALAQAFGHNPYKNGKVKIGISRSTFHYFVFAGSKDKFPSLQDVMCRGKKAFEAWGGLAQLQKVIGNVQVRWTSHSLAACGGVNNGGANNGVVNSQPTNSQPAASTGNGNTVNVPLPSRRPHPTIPLPVRRPADLNVPVPTQIAANQHNPQRPDKRVNC